MVKVSDVYNSGGQFLSAKIAEELDLYQTDIKIATVELMEIREDKKLVIHFEDMDELLPLNVTNARILQDSLGNETDDWEGNTIQLLPVKRNFQGKMVDAIQVMVVGQKKLQPDENTTDGDSSNDKNVIKQAVKQNPTIKDIVASLTDMGEQPTVKGVVAELKVQQADNSITKKHYVEALELLI
jgi:hypothetical protein